MAVTIVPNDSAEPFLLATDIDGTLLDNMHDQSWLCGFATQFPDSLCLAYMTGRSLPSVRSLVAQHLLPPPHYVCSHVGTQLFDYRDDGNDINTLFTAAVDTNHWDLDCIYQAGVGSGVQRQVFTNGQPPFHAGFFWDGTDKALQAFRTRLAPHNSCAILVSHGMFIDVIPDVLGKGRAVYFLQEYLNLSSPNIVVAGDSGNDRCMFETPFNAIVPANGYADLKVYARKPWHYHSPYCAGKGVLDGLCHFGFLRKVYMEHTDFLCS